MAKPGQKAAAPMGASVIPLDSSLFPMGDQQYRIDISFQEPYVFRVYYWAERPDAATRREDDKFHWHPDSVHNTLEAAKARMDELKLGATKRSILRK